MRLLIYILIFFACNSYYSQSIDSKVFADEIYDLNNKREFEKSIIKIYNVIYNPKSTHYDKYVAYLLKSYTYKRVYNYTEAYNNLELALQEGLKSDKAEEAKTKVAVEKFFIIFDLQKNNQIKEIIEKNKNLDLSLLDEQTKGLYLAGLAVMEITNGNYDDGNKKIDQAIEIFERVSPKDLPNIYGKKMFLYTRLNQPEKVEDAFDKAMYYAKKYNSDFYIKNLAVNMWEFYTMRKDLDKVMYYRKIFQDLDYDDNAILNLQSIKLVNLEKKIQEEEIIKQENKQRQFQLFYIVILITTTIAFIALVYSLFINRKKRLKIERENSMIRKNLEKLLHETSQSNTKIINNEIQLTERQREIIDLVKQGKTNKEIGAILYISENTVKYHLKIIYNILGIDNRNVLQETNIEI